MHITHECQQLATVCLIDGFVELQAKGVQRLSDLIHHLLFHIDRHIIDSALNRVVAKTDSVDFIFASSSVSISLTTITAHFLTNSPSVWVFFLWARSSAAKYDALVTQSNNSGFITLVNLKSPDVIVTHCMLHRHALDTALEERICTLLQSHESAASRFLKTTS